MGCGSSSLKGEDVNVNGATPAPAPRRINTNFASIDYSKETNQGRRMTEYAPHETAKAKKSHDASGSVASGRPSEAADGKASTTPLQHDEVLASNVLGTNALKSSYPHEDPASGPTNNVELKPYRTNGGDGWDNEDNNKTTATTKNQQQASHVNGTTDSDPTSLGAKAQFAHDNDPASIDNQESRKEKEKHTRSLDPSSAGTTPDDGDGRKKSWLGEKYSKYHAAKHGKNVVFSDEELKKYTGKDRKELNDWAQGRAGVGENQGAGRVNVDNARAADQYWGA